MSVDPAAIDQVAFLARSESRVRVLERLSEVQPRTRREIRECVDASRSTVTRTLTALEERDWVEHGEDGYQLTASGEIITERMLRLVTSVEVTEDLSSFLRWFPRDEFSIDIDQFAGADVTLSTDSDPYAPGRQQVDLLRRAGRFRGLLPSIDLQGTRVVHEQIVGGAFEAEIVVSSAVNGQITTGEFATLFREQLQTGQLTVFVVDGSLPFHLGLGDESVQVGVEDDDGFPRALLESTSPVIREWGEDVYERCRNRGTEQTIQAFDD